MSLEEIGHIGGPGRKAGEFFHLHSLGVDPDGNLVTGESQGTACRSSSTRAVDRRDPIDPSISLS